MLKGSWNLSNYDSSNLEKDENLAVPRSKLPKGEARGLIMDFEKTVR